MYKRALSYSKHMDTEFYFFFYVQSFRFEIIETLLRAIT